MPDNDPSRGQKQQGKDVPSFSGPLSQNASTTTTDEALTTTSTSSSVISTERELEVSLDQI